MLIVEDLEHILYIYLTCIQLAALRNLIYVNKQMSVSVDSDDPVALTILHSSDGTRQQVELQLCITSSLVYVYSFILMITALLL